MIERTLEVIEADGLHTRPANNFVKLVKAGESEVTVEKNGVVASGKSLLKIMKLGVVKGDTVTITCDGSDEETMMQTITNLLQPDGAEL